MTTHSKTRWYDKRFDTLRSSVTFKLKEDRERIDEFQRNADLAGETFGPAGEILMHPDMKSADLFRAQLDKLVANARIAGIPEQTIQPILDEADLIVQKGDIGYRIHRWLTN